MSHIEIIDTGQRIKVNPSESLKRTLEAEGIAFPRNCGGKGVCGFCRVEILDHTPAMLMREKDILGANSRYRLACLHKIETAIKLRLPRIKTDFGDKIITGFRIQTDGEGYGIAIDLGTTAIAVYLLSLASGTIIDYLNFLNPQVNFGADVMTRLEIAKEPSGLEKLHRATIAALRLKIAALISRNNLSHKSLKAVKIAGNTVMTHLLLGRAGEGLEKAPFRSPLEALEIIAVPSEALNLPAPCRVSMMPIIAGFIGGDTTAAIIATALDRKKGNRLLIDFGTNGEIVLSSGGRLYCTSTAAGPAFEGVGMACGAPAVAGAVEGVDNEGKPVLISGGNDIAGICGSGYISIIGYLRREGLVEKSGLLAKNEEGDRKWTLSSVNDRSIYVNQDDIRKFQLAKGAISAGIEILMERAEIGVNNLEELLITGSFGNRIDPYSAVITGLIPPVSPDIINFIDNAAGRGAAMMLAGKNSMRERIRAIKRNCMVVNLGEYSKFQEIYIKNLRFP